METHTIRRIAQLLLFLGPLQAFALVGCDDQTNSTGSINANGSQFASLIGENLISDANCTACHLADQTILRRLNPAPAPVLVGENGIGSRLSMNAIRDRISAHGAESGQRMPDLLHGLENREIAREDIAHYLASQGGPLNSSELRISSALLETGARLYSEVGCVACHGVEPNFGSQSANWSHASLTTFLQDPLASHPAGRMPDMALTSSEASAIAMHLINHDLDNQISVTPRSGLQLEYFDGQYSIASLQKETRKPDQSMSIAVPGVGPGAGKDFFGVRLTGEIDIPSDGRWSFWITSDDGSMLLIDDNVIIDHGGVHGATDKRGSVKLSRGPHQITILMFEASGGEELALSWSGPGVARNRVPEANFSHDTLILNPQWANASLSSEKIQRGEQMFMSIGCTACHVADMPIPNALAVAPPLTSLTPNRGCVGETVDPGLPDYEFTADERTEINSVLAAGDAIQNPLTASTAIAHTMTMLNCIACHQRGELQGPSDAIKAHFVSDGDAELGDEGRIPPTLNDVGNKLRLPALREVLLRGTKVRPYMATRMPRYGARQIEDLVVHFAAQDAKPADAIEPKFSVAAADTGRALTGIDGVSCIQCHTAAGHPSLGVPAVDLTDMHHRIRPGWFRKHLLDPQKSRPGTRMTAFWGNGGTDRIFNMYENGDPTRQVDAIWTYLSLGDSMPLPKGVVPEAGEYALIPTDEPIVFGAFMENVSPRALAVGLPENAHYVWDMEHGRVAMCWRGDFMDAEGTWHGRNARLLKPQGENVLTLPPGRAVEILKNRTSEWPATAERDRAGRTSEPWSMKGISRDENRRPVFHVQADGVRVSESLVPKLASGGTRLIRRFVVATDEGRGDLYMRAGRDISITPAGGEGRNRRWDLGEGRSIDIRGADSFVRDGPDGTKELLVKVPLLFRGQEDAVFEGTFEVEMNW